jgi:virginiamycin B lyase
MPGRVPHRVETRPAGGRSTAKLRAPAVLVVAAVIAASGCTASGIDDVAGGERTTTSTAASTTVTAAPPPSAAATTTTTGPALAPESLIVESFPVPPGSRPHDVAPAADGGVWYTAQGTGELGWLDPASGETRHVDLGPGSRPHGVIVDEDGTPWITDAGLNAIVRVDPATMQVSVYPLPADRAGAGLNTAVLDGEGLLWFTGQGGVYGSLDPATGEMNVYDAPRGRGPYGITTTPRGSVFFASLAGSYVGAVQGDGSVSVVEPPTSGQGARRVWADSTGAIWVSEWNSGNLSRYRPDLDEWATWRLPGDDPAPYAVFVDRRDIVWVSDFGSNALVRFDPTTEEFDTYELPHDPGEVRQIHGRPGEVWGAESAADHLVVVRTAGIQ